MFQFHVTRPLTSTLVTFFNLNKFVLNAALRCHGSEGSKGKLRLARCVFLEVLFSFDALTLLKLMKAFSPEASAEVFPLEIVKQRVWRFECSIINPFHFFRHFTAFDRITTIESVKTFESEDALCSTNTQRNNAWVLWKLIGLSWVLHCCKICRLVWTSQVSFWITFQHRNAQLTLKRLSTDFFSVRKRLLEF